LLTLGIPGTSRLALLMSGLIIHGVSRPHDLPDPGRADDGIFTALALANIVM
jgi:TctA family transporter